MTYLLYSLWRFMEVLFKIMVFQIRINSLLNKSPIKSNHQKVKRWRRCRRPQDAGHNRRPYAACRTRMPQVAGRMLQDTGRMLQAAPACCTHRPHPYAAPACRTLRPHPHAAPACRTCRPHPHAAPACRMPQFAPSLMYVSCAV